MANKFRVEGEMNLDGSKWAAGLSQAERATGQFASNVGAKLAGIFSAGAIAAYGRELIRWGSEINDTAIRLGVSAERVQELSFAAKQSSSDIGEMAQGMTKLQDAIEKIRSGEGADKLLKAFAAVGVSAADLARLKPDELLNKISTNLAETGINSEKTAALLDIFGKAGGKLVAVLTELNAKIAEFHKEGLGVTDEEIKSLDDAGDALDKLWLKLKVFGAGLVTHPGELAQDMGEAIIEKFPIMKSIYEAMKQNQSPRQYAALPLDKNKLKDFRVLGAGDIPGAGVNRDTEEERNLAAYKSKERIKADKSPTDELLRVGNFLGSGGVSRITAIQQRIANAAEESAKTLRRIETQLRSESDAISFPD